MSVTVADGLEAVIRLRELSARYRSLSPSLAVFVERLQAGENWCFVDSGLAGRWQLGGCSHTIFKQPTWPAVAGNFVNVSVGLCSANP